jgi:sugar/nucleoside kinase (ribokinase family)
LKRTRQIKMSSSAHPRVAVIGELNVDMLANGLTELPQMDREILAGDFEMTLGSASAIFASGMARLGHPMTFISQVGDDRFGDFCLGALREAGIPTKHISRKPNLKTGVTIVLSSTLDRALVTYPGTIASLKYPQLKMSLLRGHAHLHMTSYFLQSGLRPAVPKIFRQARTMGLTISFDPNSDPSGAWNVPVREVLAETDILFVNEAEALQLSRSRSVPRALKTLSQFVSCVVIKRGARGSIAVKDGETISAPGYKVKAVDTTGAGDSFAAGFVSAYLAGSPIAVCLRAGNACGALTVLKVGGTAGQPDRNALGKFLSTETK